MTSVKPKDDTRATLVRESAELFRRRGYAGTGLKAILAASDAPFGSLYHFFPGGKEELGVAALEAGGTTYRELVEAIFAEMSTSPPRRARSSWAPPSVLEETDYADACPIATIALEVASTSEPMRVAASKPSSHGSRCSARASSRPGSPRRVPEHSPSSSSVWWRARSCSVGAKRDTEALLTTCELAVAIVEDALPAPN